MMGEMAVSVSPGPSPDSWLTMADGLVTMLKQNGTRSRCSHDWSELNEAEYGIWREKRAVENSLHS